MYQFLLLYTWLPAFPFLFLNFFIYYLYHIPVYTSVKLLACRHISYPIYLFIHHSYHPTIHNLLYHLSLHIMWTLLEDYFRFRMSKCVQKCAFISICCKFCSTHIHTVATITLRSAETQSPFYNYYSCYTNYDNFGQN